MTAPRARGWRTILALVGVALIGGGIALMQVSDSDALSILLSLPPLGAVFPNPAMVLLGTLCMALGAVPVWWWLTPHADMATAGSSLPPPSVLAPAAAEHVSLDQRHQEAKPTPLATSSGAVPPTSSPSTAARIAGETASVGSPGTITTQGAAPAGGGWASTPRAWRLTLGIAGGAFYISALVCAAVHASGPLGMGCLLVALPLCYFGLTGSRRGTRTSPIPPSQTDRYDIGIVLALLAGYIVLNGHDLRDWRYAFIGDEWRFYEVASGIARGQRADLFNQAGVYGIHPLAGSAYQALVMRLLGVNVTGWRMSSILSAALPLCALYPLAKAIGGRLYAVAASVTYASSGLLWAFSHIGYNANDPLLAMIPAAALAYFGLRDGRSGYLFAAGALAGAGWYTLFTGRLMIVVLTLVVLSEWPRGRRFLATALIPVAGGFALVVLPLLVDNGGETFRAMFPLVGFSGVRTTQAVPHLLAGNALRAAYEFFYATGYAIQHLHYYSGSLFDPLSATGLAVGIVLALRLRAALWARLVLIWFVVTVALTTPLYYVPQVADTRVQVAIPPAALLAALGLCSAAQGLAALVPAWVGRRPLSALRRMRPLRAYGGHPVPSQVLGVDASIMGAAPASIALAVAAQGVAGGGALVPDATPGQRLSTVALVRRSLLVAAMASVIWLNGYRFYATTPPLVVQGPTALVLGAILEHPHSVIVLTGGLAGPVASYTAAPVCAPLDGYGIDPARVLRIAAGQLAPVCPGVGLFVMPPAPDVLVLLQAQSTGGSCDSGIRPLVVAPNGRQALWGRRLALAHRSASDAQTDLTQTVLSQCGALLVSGSAG